MRFKTIWTLRGMSTSERFSRTGESAMLALAHRLPRHLVFWVLVDSGVRHMRDNEVVPDVPFMDVLDRAGKAAGKT